MPSESRIGDAGKANEHLCGLSLACLDTTGELLRISLPSNDEDDVGVIIPFRRTGATALNVVDLQIPSGSAILST